MLIACGCPQGEGSVSCEHIGQGGPTPDLFVDIINGSVHQSVWSQ